MRVKRYRKFVLKKDSSTLIKKLLKIILREVFKSGFKVKRDITNMFCFSYRQNSSFWEIRLNEIEFGSAHCRLLPNFLMLV